MRRIVLIRWLLVIAAILVYAQVADFDFTSFDDGPVIFDNPNVNGGLTVHGIIWALSTSYFDFWHPLTWWSHMLDCTLFGRDAGSHHLVNLGFHVAGSLLLFGVLRRMMSLRRAGPRQPNESSPRKANGTANAFITAATPQAGAGADAPAAQNEIDWRCAMVAALFALHPAHVESVAWLSERKDTLCAFFGLLTLWFYTGYAEQSKVQSLRSKVSYGLALLFFALGLMSKPMLVTWPFVLLLLDWWPLQRVSSFKFSVSSSGATPSSIFKPKLSILLWEKLPFFVLSGISCVVTWLGMNGGQHLVAPEKVPWSLRLANVPVSYARYLGKLVWPVDLAALYPMPAHWGFWPVAGSVVVLGLVTWFALKQARSAPWLLTGWLMFLGTLVPVIGLIPNGYQSIADRYTYLPSVGIFVAGVWAVAEYSRRWKFRAILLPAAAGLALLACGTLTWRQAGCWRNSLTLWTHCVEVTRDNVMARISLGNALQQAGRIDDAMEQYHEVLCLDPNQEHANLDLGVALAVTGKLAQATNYFGRALRSRPEWSGAHLNLGYALFGLGDYSGALTHLAEAVRLDTNTVVAFTSLAGDLSARGKSDEAVSYYREALRLNPADTEAHYRLGLEFLKLNRPDEAIGQFQEAVQLRPDFSEARDSLARALEMKNAPNQ